MANDYKIAQTHGISAATLTVVTPQPTSPFAMPVLRSYSATPGFNDQGLCTVWHWDFWESESDWLAFLAIVGLDDQEVVPVSMRTRGKRGQFTVYDAYAYLPESDVDSKWSNFFMRDVNMYFTDLVAR